MCARMQVRVTLVSTVLALLTASETQAAWKATCVDGRAQAVVKVPGQSAQPVDWVTCDTLGDGICNFTVERTGCFCPAKGCCGVDEFAVPVRRQRILRHNSTGPKLRLRCRAPIPCDAEHRCAPVTRTCEDGLAAPVGEGQCDLDEQANGVCTFGFYCLEVCGSLVETVAVPVGETRIILRGNLPRIDVTQYTLRCLP
jgi:hypothetical protein